MKECKDCSSKDKTILNLKLLLAEAVDERLRLATELGNALASVRTITKQLDEAKSKTDLTYYVKAQVQNAISGLTSLGF
jgi:ribosome maturation protein Sdo1